MAFNAIGKISRGEEDEALDLLSEMKKLNTTDITPYEISADIYRKQKKYKESRNEYTTFFQNNPELKPSEGEKKFMDFNEKTMLKKPVIPIVQPKPDKQITKPKPPLKRKKRIYRKKTRKTRRSRSPKKKPPPPPSQKKPKNGLFLVDPDSISYF